MTDLVQVFAEAARTHGDRTALIAREGRITFAALEHRAAGFARACRDKGVGKGDRVLLAMGVGLDLYVALAGAWRVGATVVFPEPAMGLAGLRHAIRVARPKAFIAAGAYRWLRLMPGLWRCPLLSPSPGDADGAEPVSLSGEDLALISFTSGSTGAPKAIPRSHAFLLAQRDAVAPLLASPDAEIDLVGFPVFALINLAAGRTSVLPNWKMSRADRVTDDALHAWLTETACTRALLPPALCETLAGAIPAGLRTVFTGGGPVKPSLVDRLRAQRPDLRVVSVYGSTEAEPIADLDWSEVPATDTAAMAQGAGLLVGHPVPQVALKIVDDEILVAGDHVNRGYLDPRQDAENKRHEDGTVWHRTGDAGRVAPDGRLWLLGRHSAAVSHGGRRLFPFPLELAAESWPEIRRAALSQDANGPVLVVERTGRAPLEARAQALGIDRVIAVPKLPMDPRHRSKIDYGALRRLVEGG